MAPALKVVAGALVAGLVVWRLLPARTRAACEDAALRALLGAAARWAGLETGHAALSCGQVAYWRTKGAEDAASSSLGTRRGTLLLLHGATADRTTWASLTGLLSSSSALAGVDLLVPDLPGHGESEAAGRGQALSVANQTRWLLELLDTLGLDHALHVCGSSMGGAVALHLAATQPARVASLVLVSPAGAARLPSWLDAHVAAGHSNPVTAAVADGSAYQAVLRVVMAKPPYLPPFVAAALARTQTRRVAINAKISRVGVLSLFLCLCVCVCAVCVCVCVSVYVCLCCRICVYLFTAPAEARAQLSYARPLARARSPLRTRTRSPARTLRKTWTRRRYSRSSPRPLPCCGAQRTR
jgi:pimeloyl-ACP methyl ester carboxylesterase